MSSDTESSTSPQLVRRLSPFVFLFSLLLRGCALPLYLHKGAVQTKANQGDTAAAYMLYRQLSGERQTFIQAWEWLCHAASRGNVAARLEVAEWNFDEIHDKRIEWLPDVGILPDVRVAYMWYLLAEANGDIDIRTELSNLEENMDSDQIAQAIRMFRNWVPGDCPSKEHRLRPPWKFRN